MYARLILSCLPKEDATNVTLPSRVVIFTEDKAPEGWTRPVVKGDPGSSTDSRVRGAILAQAQAAEGGDDEGSDDGTE